MSAESPTAPEFPTPTLVSALHPESDLRMREYLDGIFDRLGDKRRRESFALYACGIFGEGERKSVEPIAARATGAPGETEAMHRKLLRFVGESAWDDAPIRMYAARYGVAQLQQAHGPIRHWIIDDTGFIKQGKLSPGGHGQPS